jgi:hypothetical protein
MQIVQKLPTRALSVTAENEWIFGLFKAGASLLNIKGMPSSRSAK